MNDDYQWKWFYAGETAQVKLESGDDLAHLASLDPKLWFAISMPTKGVRFDGRMLELMDSDKDGRIRADEVVGAIEFLKSKGVDLDSVFKSGEAEEKALADVLSRQGDLAKFEPSAEELAAMGEWEAKGRDKAVAVLGEDTAAANAALAAVEPVVDAFFTPPADMPLVTEAPDVALPLKDHLNPKYLEAIVAFAEKVVKPLFGERDTLSRLDWKAVKAAFAPYRAWVASKPVMNAAAKAALDDEERVLRYKLHLVEFLENFVNMKRLYGEDSLAIFQTGTLRIDAKEMNLCFDVDSEAAHSALAAKSNCCILYLKLTRPAEKAERSVCAVVTAGKVAGLYAGRNGVFCDRDGKYWEAVVTKVVESQVSLAEAFWSPWKKMGEGIAAAVKKFLGDKQSKSEAAVQSALTTQPPAEGQNSQAGAAMASSVAAIGIGVGMVGAAFASVMAVISSMAWWEILVGIVAIVVAVSLPSVILAWFKLRRRDISAILNASGWAINRQMRFSMARARGFTRLACR